jgi:hypothetical protein
MSVKGLEKEHGSTNVVSCAARNLCALVRLGGIPWFVRNVSVMLQSSRATIVPQLFFVMPCVGLSNYAVIGLNRNVLQCKLRYLYITA